MRPPGQSCCSASASRKDSGGRIRRGLAAVGLTGAVLVVAGCGIAGPGPSTAENPTVRRSELNDAGGQPCPDELPIGDDPSGHGFGVEHVANQLPRLLEPREAWVCRYDNFDRETTSSGGAVLGWRLAGDAEPVAREDLPALQAALEDLTLPDDPDRACTSGLGPRWMVAYSHDGDLTGVVVDDFGCRDVRLTGTPHTMPPGADDQDGIVGGVLQGGPAILDALGLGRLE